MAIDTRNLDQMLNELRAATALVQGKAVATPQGGGSVDFAAALKAAIEQVNAAQQQAQQLAQEFAAGNDKVDLQDVMINLQKASLSFQQMVQVRNKLVTAYQEVMNMPV